jgi:hypothetical protein
MTIKEVEKNENRRGCEKVHGAGFSQSYNSKCASEEYAN